MGILVSVATWFFTSSLGQAIIAFVTKHLEEDVKEWLAWHAQQKANADAAKASVEPLKNAKTGDEIDKASDSAVTGL